MNSLTFLLLNCALCACLLVSLTHARLVPSNNSPSDCGTASCPAGTTCVMKGKDVLCCDAEGECEKAEGGSGSGGGSNGGSACQSVFCQEYAHCITSKGAAKCVCDNGYVQQGSDCVPKACLSCPANSACVSAECQCNDGFEMKSGQCVAEGGESICLECPINSRCIYNASVYQCQCNPGFVWKTGDCEPDPCAVMICPANAVCDEGVCDCKPGYDFLNNACVKENPGPCVQSDCPENSTCVTNATYSECVCDPGFLSVGDSCEKDLCLNVKCPKNGYCNDGTCECDEGYDMQNGACVDNGGTHGPNPCGSCPSNAVCVILGTKSSCQCNDGFALKAGKCVGAKGGVMDPCASKKCPKYSTCANGTCSCNKGYSWANSTTCTKAKADPCSKRSCPKKSKCVANGTVASCACISGYFVKGNGCLKDTCNPKKCPKFSSCLSGVCACIKGYKLANSTCVKDAKSPCLNRKCPQNSSCVANGTQTACVCAKGFVAISGDKCVKDACMTARCGWNLTCTNTEKGARCVCSNGYTLVKKQCIALCDAKPCPKGQICSVVKGLRACKAKAKTPVKPAPKPKTSAKRSIFPI